MGVFITVHSICSILNPVLCNILPAAHAITRCDSASSLFGIGKRTVFSSPGPKVQVNYCHHLASVVCRLLSVVCRLFTFQASSPKPQGRLEPNLAGMFLGWSSTKLLFFRSSRIFNMAARANNML